MPATHPTILATSAGYRPHPRLRFTFGPMMALAVDLARERSDIGSGAPRICNIGTAGGDETRGQRDMEEAAREAGYELHHLSLFPMPNVPDVEGYLRSFDVIWVNGGSVVNLLAVWRAHGLPEILRRAWQDGVVLAGISAGSICWFEGGVTDSFGPELRRSGRRDGDPDVHPGRCSQASRSRAVSPFGISTRCTGSVSTRPRVISSGAA